MKCDAISNVTEIEFYFLIRRNFNTSKMLKKLNKFYKLINTSECLLYAYSSQSK